MKFNLKSLLALAIASSALVLTGCGDKNTDVNTIKVGVMAGAEAQVAEVAAKVAKNDYGLNFNSRGRVVTIDLVDLKSPPSARSRPVPIAKSIEKVEIRTG